MSDHAPRPGGLSRRSLLGAAATAVVAGSTAARLLQQTGRDEYDATGGFGLVVAQHELRVDHASLAEVRSEQQHGALAPYVTVGLSVPPGIDPGHLAAAGIRSRGADGWSEWMPVPFSLEEGPDGDTAEANENHRWVTQPFWVGFADGLEVDLPPGIAEQVAVHLVRETPVILGYHEEGVEEISTAPRPQIRSRSTWNARAPKQAMTFDSRLDMAVVHHTVSRNSYTTGEVPGMLASIQAYHMNTNGWNDIAYNFMVDRFGRIWEARHGGVTRLPRGGHAAGFNTRTTGVCALGDFHAHASGVRPSQAMLDAFNRVLAWKLGHHGVDPSTTVRYTAGTGSRSAQYPAGRTGTFSRIVGHGDVGATACPGSYLASHLPAMRRQAAALQSFPDVPGDAYYAAGVAWLSDKNITTGVGTTGLYKPDDPVTRAQMAAFLWRLMDEPPVSRAHGFRDVPANSYYEPAVRWLRAANVTDGMGGPGLYSPNADVTRSQMVAFLWRISGRRGGYGAHGFTDVPRGSFYEDALRWASATGITTGVGGTRRFDPFGRVTRGQMAAFLHRLASTRSAWSASAAASKPSTVLF